MAAQRTQIYLTAEQRRRLDALARELGKPLARLIRDAVDEYLEEVAPHPEAALDASFGAAPGFEAPARSEWDARDPLASRG